MVKKSNIIILGLIAAAFAVSAYFYPQMPAEMASHWNAKGEVDGYMSSFWGTFMLPIFMLGIAGLFAIIPKIDPLRHNIEHFRKYFDMFIIMIMGFFVYIHLMVIFANLGIAFNMGALMLPALGILFYGIAILIENAKQNWFIGIRTPWTLSSEEVWDKTHKIGAKLFKISAVLAVAGTFFGDYALWFILIPVIGSTIYLVLYSYFEYKKLGKFK